MATIGRFHAKDDNYEGFIETRLFHTSAKIVKVGAKGEKAPDYRVLAGLYEIGAAWSKTSEAGKSYLFVTLDDPSFAAPIPCRLHETSEGFELIWTRA